MGRDKALLDYRGRTFLSHLVYLALPRVESVTVVLGHHAESIRRTVPASPRVRVVLNDHYDRGMLSSLQAGLRALPDGTDWTLWMLVDHPAVRGSTLDRLLDAAADSGAPLVIPRFGGRRGHPIALSREVADELLGLGPHGRPHDVVRPRYPETCFVDLPDPAVLVDVDRPADYSALDQPSGP